MMPRDTDAVKGTKIGRANARRVWSFARPYRGTIGLFLSFILIAALLGVVPPLVVRQIIDHAIPDQDRSADLVAHRHRRRRGDGRCRAPDRTALVQRPRRRGAHRRPAARPVREGAAPARGVLHPHPDRGDHEPPQQRRGRRADRGHEHARQRGQQRGRARHVAGHDAGARVADHAAGPGRAAAVHHPGPPGGAPAAGHLARADAAQRRDEHPDDRALQRGRRRAGEAVRLARPRERAVRRARQRGARRRHPSRRCSGACSSSRSASSPRWAPRRSTASAASSWSTATSTSARSSRSQRS